jgi:tetratricopeptide (TPR) repeat protein
MNRLYHRDQMSASDNQFARGANCAIGTAPVKICSPLILTVATVVLANTSAVKAQDSSVDKLIKKLPPPEKVVQIDPASNDPLAKKTIDAINASNFGSAYPMSQKLAARYPNSAGAHSLHGELALLLQRYPEATDAFHKVISIQPNSAFAYVGLALSEAAQNRTSAAMSNFQQVTRLQPAADIGWIGLSACAEKLGRKGDSLQYARRATVVAPSSFAAWLQLSHVEGISGNRKASANALARANELRRKAPKSNR